MQASLYTAAQVQAASAGLVPAPALIGHFAARDSGIVHWAQVSCVARRPCTLHNLPERVRFAQLSIFSVLIKFCYFWTMFYPKLAF